MLITVVTPSYNQGHYLAETIESVLGQEGDFRIDYIIVDGGSRDDSVEVIRRYQALLEKGSWPVRCAGINYRWSSERDRGQTDALMKGFRMSQGEILAWLNSDDRYLPGTLAKVAHVFEEEPQVGAVYGKSRFVDAGGRVIGSYPTEPFEYQRLAEANFICQPSAFFTKKALDAVQGLDTTLHYAMDYDLWIRLAGKERFRYIPEFLSDYRLHDASKTMSPKDALANHREALETVRRHYGWAPLNRVYGYCRSRVACLLPGFLSGSMALTVLVSVPVTVFTYLCYNRGMRGKDLKMLNKNTWRNLFRQWIDLHTRG